jgi:hypothetical protein
VRKRDRNSSCSPLRKWEQRLQDEVLDEMVPYERSGTQKLKRKKKEGKVVVGPVLELKLAYLPSSFSSSSSFSFFFNYKPLINRACLSWRLCLFAYRLSDAFIKWATALLITIHQGGLQHCFLPSHSETPSSEVLVSYVLREWFVFPKKLKSE